LNNKEIKSPSDPNRIYVATETGALLAFTKTP
jgi:hypothetical protein